LTLIDLLKKKLKKKPPFEPAEPDPPPWDVPLDQTVAVPIIVDGVPFL
jgi:hypothetical protein